MDWGLAAGAGAALGGVPLVSSLFESGVNAYSQHQTNKTNKQIAEDANAASAKQADAQMEFQERMSNTSYQRGMEDMKKAGLNPILAYSQGGASAPSGAQGTVQTAKMEPIKMSGLSSSALSAAQMAQQQKRDDSQIDLQKQQTLSTAASTQKQLAETDKTHVQTRNEIEAAKRQAEIHGKTSTARDLHEQEAMWDKKMLEYNKINQNIQTGTRTIEGVGDAATSFLPGKKFFNNILGRGASSAKDLKKHVPPTEQSKAFLKEKLRKQYSPHSAGW